MCKNVSAVKPTAKEIERSHTPDSMPNKSSSGDSSVVNTGWPIQPRPRLAIVMPSCVALKYELR